MEYILSMNEACKEAGEPISGSVLLDKLSTARVLDLEIEYSPPGEWKFFSLNVGREATWVCMANGGKKGAVGGPWTLVHPDQRGGILLVSVTQTTGRFCTLLVSLGCST